MNAKPERGAAMYSRKKTSGFTLIEVMIATVIVAILASIAIPSYQDHVRRGNRTAAQAAMMDIVNRQQQFLLVNRRYADSLTELNYTFPAEVVAKYNVSNTGNITLARYLDASCTVQADTGSAPSFVISLQPRGSQASDGNLHLSNTGTKCPANKW